MHNNLGGLLHAKGNLVGAEEHYHKALAEVEWQFGRGHVNTLTEVNNLAGILQARGKVKEAITMFRDVLSRLPKEPPNTFASMLNLGAMLLSQDELEEARKLIEETHDKSLKHFGAGHPDTLNAMHTLAALRERQGQFEMAAKLYRDTLAGLIKQFGESHSRTLQTKNNLGVLLHTRGVLVESTTLLREALDGAEAVGQRSS